MSPYNTSSQSILIFFIQMEEVIEYNFLIIGRSGAGKSATTKFLTGDPSIAVANSLKEVTTEVKFYKGMTIQLGNTAPIEISKQLGSSQSQNKKRVRFTVLDIPGLDNLGNRFRVREKLLEILQRQKISLHGIIYVSSLTERDTVDCNKLFKFVQQLPWNQELKKSVLVPILTKYDNLIIDSPQQQISSIKEQYSKMFSGVGYQQAWSKRVYWVNHTKSLQFKIKIRDQIKQVYQKQVQRLVDLVGKHNKLLTADSIRAYIQEQQLYIARRIIQKIKNEEIPCRRDIVQHKVALKIMIRPKKFYQSVTTVSASSIGMIISQLCKNDIPSSLSMILTGLPIALAFLNLTKSTTKMAGKGKHQNYEKDLDNSYSKVHLQNICKQIKDTLFSEWKQFTEKMQFYIEDKLLYCKFNYPFKLEQANGTGLIFLDPMTFLQLKIDQKSFQKVWSVEQDQHFDMKMHYPMQIPKFPKSQVKKMTEPYKAKYKLGDKKYQHYPMIFKMQIPEFEDEMTWQPDIRIQCCLKVFDQEILQKNIQVDRVQFDQPLI